MTGSGKIYRLLKFDEAAFVEAGFTPSLAKKFQNGFPEDWKECLVKFLTISRPQKQAKSSTPVPKKIKTDRKLEKTPQRRSSLPSAFMSEQPTVLLLCSSYAICNRFWDQQEVGGKW